MKNSYYANLFKRLFTRFSFVFPFIILIVIFVTGLIFNFCLDKSYISIDFNQKLISPSDDFLFGTNSQGQSLLYLVFIGSYNTLLFAALATIVNLLIGCIFGIIWGSSTKLDNIMICIKNILDNIPTLFIYVILIYALGNGLFTVLLVIIIFGWINIATLVRNNLIMSRDKDYNKMSKLLKTKKYKIAIYNYLPSLLPIIFNSIAISFPEIISLEITLSYFNISLGDYGTSLGSLLHDSMSNNNSFSHPYLFIFPFIFLLIINLCYFYIGKTISSLSNQKEVSYDD